MIPKPCRRRNPLYGDREELVLAGTREAALRGADALIVLTEWQEFKAPDFDTIRTKLKTPVIFDGRNLYDPARMARRGITYYGIGRGVRAGVGGWPLKGRCSARGTFSRVWSEA